VFIVNVSIYFGVTKKQSKTTMQKKSIVIVRPNKKLHADTQSYAVFCACRKLHFSTKNRVTLGAGELGVRLIRVRGMSGECRIPILLLRKGVKNEKDELCR